MIFSWLGILSSLKNAPGFLLTYWKQLSIIGLVCMVFYQNFMETEWLKWVGIRTISGIEQEYVAKLDVVEDQLLTCESSRETLKEQIALTNEQVQKWADVSEQLQNSQDKLSAELEKMRKESEQAVQDILEGPTPEGCDAAVDFLREAAQGELRWSSQQQ